MFEIITRFFIVIASDFLVAVITAIPLMYLWDFAVPPLFGLPEITLAQAVALMLIARFLIPTSSVTTISKD